MAPVLLAYPTPSRTSKYEAISAPGAELTSGLPPQRIRQSGVAAAWAENDNAMAAVAARQAIKRLIRTRGPSRPSDLPSRFLTCLPQAWKAPAMTAVGLGSRWNRLPKTRPGQL